MSKMHVNEFDINLDFMKTLIRQQFPEFSMLPIIQVDSIGTVNYIYRLGKEFYIRLPRIIDSNEIEREWKLLAHLAPHVTMKIPEPFALGQPSATYPGNWAIYKWLDGDSYSDALILDEEDAARDLANFVNQLHAVDVTSTAPKAGRSPLLELNSKTLESIAEAAEAKDMLDAARVLEAWQDSLAALAWDGHPVWIHADLLRSNLLVSSGSLNAVIDFGSAGIGDPAFDLIPAWSVFNTKGRKTFQKAIHADKDTWLRARGYALHQAVLIIPYYRVSNPKFVQLAIRTLTEILDDIKQG